MRDKEVEETFFIYFADPKTFGKGITIRIKNEICK